HPFLIVSSARCARPGSPSAPTGSSWLARRLAADFTRTVPRHPLGRVQFWGKSFMDSHDLAAARAVPRASARPILRDRRGLIYEPAIGPRLKVLLFVIFGGVAVLGATGAYLVSISLLEWIRAPRVYTTEFSLWMLFVHVFIGVLLTAPFIIFGTFHLATARHRKNRRAVKLGICVFVSG